ncbi:MAG: minor capsid protein [Clostridia bacterium]|nr:minor capsid protein [Clostridia bacterium]
MSPYPVNLLPDPLPPLNSPEYVELSRKIARHTGAAAKAPRTFAEALRRRAENRYRNLINRIFRELDLAIRQAPTVEAVQQAISKFIVSPRFDSMCRQAASQMVTMLAVGQKASWREAAAASSQGRRIYKALQQELRSTAIGPAVQSVIQQNAALIKTVPRTMARKFTALAEKRRFEGVRPEDITKEIRAAAQNLREFEARRIARTESAKASTALIKARSENLGLDFYTWLSVGDERVRSSHRNMNGILCRWSDPPNPEALFPGDDSHNSGGCYDPGCIYNCRCRARPVLAPEDIDFPVKVHVSGSVESIPSLKAFRQRFGLPEEKGD